MKFLKYVKSFLASAAAVCVLAVACPVFSAAVADNISYTQIGNSGAVITVSEKSVASVYVDDTSIASAVLSGNKITVTGVQDAVGVATVSVVYENRITERIAVPIGYTTFIFNGDELTVYPGSDQNFEVTGINSAAEEYVLEATALSDGGELYQNADEYKLCVNIKKSGGTYAFTGSSEDMCIDVNKEAHTPAYMLLAGLELSSSFTAPITVKKNSSTTVNITSLEGHSNTLSDTEFNNADIYGSADDGGDGTNAEYAESAPIKGKAYANITLDGSGELNLICATKNGIKVGDYGALTIDGPTVNITSAGHGISCDNILEIKSGNINVDAAEDGIRTDPAAVDSTLGCTGNISISGGNITVNAGSDGVQAAQDLSISGGFFVIKTMAGYSDSAFDSSTMSCKGIKASFNTDDSSDTSEATNKLEISGGTFVINTPDDAVHCDAYVVITGGEFHIKTADDGVHADTSLTLGEENGDDSDILIEVITSYEALEAGNVYIYSGTYDVVSSDDGINAAGDSTEGFNPGGQPGWGGGWGGNWGSDSSTATTADYNIYVYGGNVKVNANGDGIDSNGALEFTGGNTVVWGQQAGGDNAALDCETSLIINGGTVFAAGANSMVHNPSSSSQKYITSTTTYSAGKTVNVVYNSNVIYNAVALKNVNYVIYSSPEMSSSSGWSVTSDDSYLILTGDLNGDGTVDIRDMVRMKAYLSDSSVTVYANPDLNSDSSENAYDLSIIKQYVLGSITL